MNENINKFILGECYTRQQIHDVVGGELVTYLPSVNRKIVAGCFTFGLNPKLPYKILVGDAPLVVQKARMLCEQEEPVPVFSKIDVNKWEYIGYFRAKYIDNAIDIKLHAFEAGRNDVVGILELEEVK